MYIMYYVHTFWEKGQAYNNKQNKSCSLMYASVQTIPLELFPLGSAMKNQVSS